MTRGEARWNHVASILVGGTGAVYAWMLYVMENDDPFSLVGHPWQPHVQHLHVLFAPLLVFAVGLIWTRHVWARVRSGFRSRRKSGLALFALAPVMIVSGYLVQIAIDDTWRTVWVWTHGVSSFAWLAVYVAHQFSRRGQTSPSGERAEAESRAR